MSDGFLGRWSRRKQDLREGKPLAEAVPDAARPATHVAPSPAAEPVVVSSDQAVAPTEAPPLTLQDTQALTPASDFKPFMARGVTPDVRNAAVKKLFADPHFNVMDRLDTYIDDYSQPDPLPAAMLRQMASAQFLKLFDDDETRPVPATPAPQPVALNNPSTGHGVDSLPGPDVAQSGLASGLPAACANALTPGPTPEPTEHAHTDLRLQPDHAPGRESAGPGPA